MQIRDRIKDFRRVPAADLIANSANWRVDPGRQKRGLMAVLAEIGYADALVVRELPDGRLELIDGHLRKELTPDATVPVLIVDLNDQEAKTLLAAHDALGAMATADTAALASLLGDLVVSTDELGALVADIKGQFGVATAIDDEDDDSETVSGLLEDAENLAEKWQTSRGQGWTIRCAGSHRLLCGDATSEQDVGRLLDGARPQLMVTDPPYGVNYNPRWRSDSDAPSMRGGKTRRKGTVANDHLADWTDAWKLSPASVAYVWHASVFAATVAVNLQSAQFDIRAQIVWRKPTLVISRGHYHYQHEPCWYAVRRGKSASWIGDRKQSTVWDVPLKDDEEAGGHGTQKPTQCMLRPIANHRGNVLDPFVGSGTTIVAAERLKRGCFAMEIDPTYCAVVLERMSRLGCQIERWS